MNVKIESWSGRLGNNLQQVIQAVGIAVEKGYNVILPKHHYFTKDYIQINPNIHKKHPVYTATDPIPLNEEQKKKVLHIVKGIFRIQHVTPLHPNDLVIHIRGGDIFSDNPHPDYVMPPLSYYKGILDTHSFRKIYIISEDTKNPCVKALMEHNPSIEFKQQTLYSDILLLLGAYNVIESYGSFTTLLVLSNTIRRIFKPSYQVETHSFAGVIRIPLDMYYREQHPWKNSLEQQKRVLLYPYQAEE